MTRSSMQRPIGILGGSFDPVHRGHLALAADAIAGLSLQTLHLIPAGQPWQKGRLADPVHRVRMLELAIAQLDTQRRSAIVLDDREVRRGGPSYTIDTLRSLRAEVGPGRPLVLIMGSDQFERLPTWRDWRALLDHAHLAIARRNDAVLAVDYVLQEFANERWADPGRLAERPAGWICEFAMTPVDASSTEVRELLSCSTQTAAREARLAALMPASVLDYIRRHHLYG